MTLIVKCESFSSTRHARFEAITGWNRQNAIALDSSLLRSERASTGTKKTLIYRCASIFSEEKARISLSKHNKAKSTFRHRVPPKITLSLFHLYSSAHPLRSLDGPRNLAGDEYTRPTVAQVEGSIGIIRNRDAVPSILRMHRCLPTAVLVLPHLVLAAGVVLEFGPIEISKISVRSSDKAGN